MFDRTDLQILEKIQQSNHHMTHTDLAKEIDSPINPGSPASDTTVLRSIKKMEKAGVIRSYGVRLDPEKLGLDFLAHVGVKLGKYRPEDLAHFRAKMAEHPNILTCEAVTSPVIDYLLKVATTNSKKFYAIMKEIHDIPVVVDFITMVVVDEVKNTAALPLTHLYPKYPPHMTSKKRNGTSPTRHGSVAEEMISNSPPCA